MRVNFEDYFVESHSQVIINQIDAFLVADDIKSVDSNNRTLLQTSILAGDKFNAVTEHLVNLGADVNGTRKTGYYPLELAILTGNLAAVSLLRNSGRLKYNRKSDCSADYAAMKGYTEVLKMLIDEGCNINKKDVFSPIHWAVQEGHLHCVRLLCEHGADVNARDEEGITPLYLAAGEGNVEIVKLLLEYSADVNLASSTGTTPLIIASAWEKYDVMKILLSAGSNVNDADNDGRTALFYARVRGKEGLCNFLVASGASTDVADNYGIAYSDLSTDDIRHRLNEELFG